MAKSALDWFKKAYKGGNKGGVMSSSTVKRPIVKKHNPNATQTTWSLPSGKLTKTPLHPAGVKKQVGADEQGAESLSGAARAKSAAAKKAKRDAANIQAEKNNTANANLSKATSAATTAALKRLVGNGKSGSGNNQDWYVKDNGDVRATGFQQNLAKEQVMRAMEQEKKRNMRKGGSDD